MRRIVLVVALVVVAAACDWPQFLGGPAQTGSTPDNSITAAALAAGTLEPQWGASLGQSSTRQPVLRARGVVYANIPGDEIQAYDTDGTPLWSTSVGSSGVDDFAIADGILVASRFDGSLTAYDATGTEGCSGAPKVCNPLWTAAPIGFSPSIAIADGVVYVTVDEALAVGNVGLATYDLAGVQTCSPGPPPGVDVCHPLWSVVHPGFASSAPAVSGDTVYFTSTEGLHAYATLGQFRWDATIPGGPASTRPPAVANGKVFVAGAAPKHVLGFDAAGEQRCGGTPKRCHVIWRARRAGPSPSVAYGMVYAGTPDGLAAFDATGGSGCTGATVRTCPVQWTYPRAEADCLWIGISCTSPYEITLAGGVVYQGVATGGTGNLNAWDARGTIGCSGTPKTCNPIGGSFGSRGAVAISDGLVFTIEGPGGSFLRALALVPD